MTTTLDALRAQLASIIATAGAALAMLGDADDADDAGTTAASASSADVELREPLPAGGGAGNGRPCRHRRREPTGGFGGVPMAYHCNDCGADFAAGG